jgi:hypothetical protein
MDRPCVLLHMSTEIHVPGKYALHLVYFLEKWYIACFVARLTNREIGFIYPSHGKDSDGRTGCPWH